MFHTKLPLLCLKLLWLSNGANICTNFASFHSYTQGNLSANNKALISLCPSLELLKIDYCEISSLLSLLEEAEMPKLKTVMIYGELILIKDRKKLQEKVQAITSMTKDVEFMIRKVRFIYTKSYDLHTHPFLALEGTPLAASVGSVFFEHSTTGEEMDWVKRLFPSAVTTDIDSYDWWRVSSLCDLKKKFEDSDSDSENEYYDEFGGVGW